MIPFLIVLASLFFGVPRVGGGDPQVKKIRIVIDKCSPRRRG